MSSDMRAIRVNEKYHGTPWMLAYDEPLTSRNPLIEEIQKERNIKRIIDSYWTDGPQGNKTSISLLYHFHQFAGLPGFVVAGGPSLRGFDFTQLAGRYTIGVNMIFKAFNPTLVYAADPEIIIGHFRRWGDKFKTKLVIGDIQNYPSNTPEWFPVHYVRYAGLHGIPTGISEIYTGSFSGYGAINLAVALGFNPIYLLGYDYREIEGKTHALDDWPHPPGYVENYLPSARKEVDDFAPLAAAHGIEIFNLSRESLLQNYEKVGIGEVL